MSRYNFWICLFIWLCQHKVEYASLLFSLALGLSALRAPPPQNTHTHAHTIISVF